MKLPVPTTSIGALASAITRHLSTPKPEDTTIRTLGYPAWSSASRMCQTAAAETRERALRAQEVAMSALNLPPASDVERLTRRLRAVSQRLEGIEDALDRLDERIEGAGSDSAAARRLSAIEAALARIEPAVLAAPRPARKTSASTRKAPGSSSTGSSSKKAPAARSRAR